MRECISVIQATASVVLCYNSLGHLDTPWCIHSLPSHSDSHFAASLLLNWSPSFQCCFLSIPAPDNSLGELSKAQVTLFLFTHISVASQYSKDKILNSLPDTKALCVFPAATGPHAVQFLLIPRIPSVFLPTLTLAFKSH